MKRVVGINFSFTEESLQDRAFDSSRQDHVGVSLMRLRGFFNRHGVEVHTLDRVDFQDPDVQYVIYVDYSWRSLLHDRYLKAIPRHKRVLFMLEPSNVNPTLYFVPWLRKRFDVIFTWNDALAARYGYIHCNGFPWADPDDYMENQFADLTFASKKFLVAINSNRWSYMPTSAFDLRIKVFRHFEKRCPGQFDLFGQAWNQPRVFYEKWTGFHTFDCYRGPIPISIESKLSVLSNYRFTICIENNVNESGYVNDKFIDCLCARCVPVYYAWKGACKYVPSDCFINFRDFDTLDSLNRYLQNMDSSTYDGYVAAINRFLQSDAARHFTCANMFGTLIRHLYPDLGSA